MGFGVDTPYGEVPTREVVVMVPAMMEVRSVFESGMGAYLPRVQRTCAPLVGEPVSTPWDGAAPVWNSNQPAIMSRRNWVFNTVGGGDDP